MKRTGKTLALLVPLVLLAGVPTAQAGTYSHPYEGGGNFGWFCGWLGPFCFWGAPTKDCPPNGGDPRPVPEPEMLSLFAVGTVSAALAAYRRRRK
jgi:hypothetical protein